MGFRTKSLANLGVSLQIRLPGIEADREVVSIAPPDAQCAIFPRIIIGAFLVARRKHLLVRKTKIEALDAVAAPLLTYRRSGIPTGIACWSRPGILAKQKRQNV